MLLRQCNLATIKIFCGQPAQKRYRCSNGDEQILRKVRNNYRSRNLIGHYPFWVISPRNSTSFTRPFLAGRRAWVGHETNVPSPTTPTHPRAAPTHPYSYIYVKSSTGPYYVPSPTTQGRSPYPEEVGHKKPNIGAG